MLLLIYSRKEVKGCENLGTSDKFQMARSGKSFIELVTFSKLLKERLSTLKDDVNKEGHSTRKIQKVLCGTVFQKYIIRTGNHGMIKPERRQILTLISK